MERQLNDTISYLDALDAVFLDDFCSVMEEYLTLTDECIAANA